MAINTCLSHSHAHTCKHATHTHIYKRPHMHAHAHMHTHRLTHAHTCTPPMEQLANHRPCFCHRAMASHGAAHYISTASLTMYNSATADECAPRLRGACAPRLRAHVLRDCGHETWCTLPLGCKCTTRPLRNVSTKSHVCDILADGHQTRNVGFIASYHPMLAHWTRLHPRLRIAPDVGLTTTTRDCGRQLRHTMTNYLINPCRSDAGLGHVT